MSEEAIVRRSEPGGDGECVGIVGEPVHPARPGALPQLADRRRIEPDPLEHQHDVHRRAREQGGEARGERPAHDGVESGHALLASEHLASQRAERGGEGETAAVVAPVERRDQHDPQPGERARGHIST